MTKKDRRQLVEEFKAVFLTKDEARGVFLTKGEARDLFLTKEDAVNFFVTKSEFNDFKGEMLDFKAEMTEFKDHAYKSFDFLVSSIKEMRQESAAMWDLYKRHDNRLDHLEGFVFKS